MKLSCIIPVYNRYSTLKDAVESAMAQTISDIEIIVIDDGSDPEVESILRPYLPAIRLIRLEKNSGVSRARNIGIGEAKGDYVAFLDSDDVWLPFKSKKQLDKMNKDDCLVGHTDEFWFKQGRFINQGKKHKRYGGFIFEKVLDICRMSPSSTIIHKCVFETAGMFDENMQSCEDYDLILRLAANFKISYLPMRTIIKRSITCDQLSSQIEHIESVRLESLQKFFDSSLSLSHQRKACITQELERKRAIVSTGRN